MLFTQTPSPPYYAVIFTSKRTNVEQKQYDAAAQKNGRISERSKWVSWNRKCTR
ncbi:hypothetical protein BsIDN1_52150 [Bacillus safensis]|uniref:Uncharacterized protein n=1 Tax=Bacillus safensis TaxID=561879 RepID=A0A5S9MDQ0_BACIA|nr:hypothetical protein BsIDN1_52150 [Bacillus safensis]